MLKVEVSNLLSERHSNGCLVTFPWIKISPCETFSPAPNLQAFARWRGPAWSPSQRSQLRTQHSVGQASCRWWGSGRGSWCRCRPPQWPHLGRPQDSALEETFAGKPSDLEWKPHLSCQGQSQGPHEGRSENIEFACREIQSMPIQANDPAGIATPCFLLFIIESKPNETKT